MTKYDARAIIEDAVANAMKGQESFVLNVQEASKQGRDIKDMTDNRNARSAIAIYAELKGIRVALTEIAQMMADSKGNPSS